MRIKGNLTIISALIATLGVIGLVETVGADPEESQRLRGLGGRTFAIQVTNLTAQTPPEHNCYTFNEDGSWIDYRFLLGFPIPGTWAQDSVGASTSYTATAQAPLQFVTIDLIQNGTVTPALGMGTLQLEAMSNAKVVSNIDGTVLVEADFHSVGYEDSECVPPTP